MACLDTSALLDLSGSSGRRSQGRVRRKLQDAQQTGEVLATTRFNIAELWVGIHRSRDSAGELAKVEALVRPLVILDFDQRAAEIFGRVVGYLQESGSVIGDTDALIGSVCIVSGHSILTRNTAHFSRIPGLAVETY
jgi:tRNA(fMet)-specific endonuclease VapC